MNKANTIGFGKYADTPIWDVPDDYLEWFLNNVQKETATFAYTLVEGEFIKRKQELREK